LERIKIFWQDHVTKGLTAENHMKTNITSEQAHSLAVRYNAFLQAVYADNENAKRAWGVMLVETQRATDVELVPEALMQLHLGDQYPALPGVPVADAMEHFQQSCRRRDGWTIAAALLATAALYIGYLLAGSAGAAIGIFGG
jgi:DnaJ-domain-containing protein 1